MNNTKIYVCEACNYKTLRSYDYNRHMASYKHACSSDFANSNKRENEDDGFFTCICKKKYKYNSGLIRHKNTCKTYSKLMNREEINNEDIEKMFSYFMKMQRTQLEMQTGQLEIQMRQTTQNQYIIERMDKQDELIQRTIERQIVSNIGVQNNIQNNNFCLNIFLNETCKNAMDLDDFVESIEVGIEDIERMERLDYASGISKLIVDKLNQATITGRPLHCTDSKRDIIYIKIKANWQKADDNLKTRFIHAIKRIAQKNMQAINLWTQKNPEWNDPRSKTNDKYLRIVSNSMSGATEEEQKFNMDKIVKNIIREVKIDKKY
jgi:hypothetical protein